MTLLCFFTDAQRTEECVEGKKVTERNKESTVMASFLCIGTWQTHTGVSQ